MLQALSGGMGERREDTDDSIINGFADDENESTEYRTAQEPNICRRCRVPLSTRARYCRSCYNERALWMPERPNKRRLVRRYRSRSSSHLGVDNDVLFVPEKNSQMRGDVRVPNPMYSNLPNRLGRSRERLSSSDSDYNYDKERKLARLERRRYIRACQESARTDTSDVSSDSSEYEERPCTECGIRLQSAFLVHDRTAHCCLCYKCAEDLYRRKGSCPECGKSIDHIIRRNVC